MILRFKYIAEEFDEADAEIYVRVVPDSGKDIDYASIEDAISSYIDSVESFSYEGLITDVLDSFGYKYEFIEPEYTFLI